MTSFAMVSQGVCGACVWALEPDTLWPWQFVWALCLSLCLFEMDIILAPSLSNYRSGSVRQYRKCLESISRALGP